jgi:uncharacterized protein (DUF2235 family)
MKNVVLCFDQVREPSDARSASNATALFGLLDQSPDQVCWYRAEAVTRHRAGARVDERAALDGAYAFLRRHWQPGDRIFVFGAGRGGYCAEALVRLLNTVGVLPRDLDDLVDFCVGAYSSPRTVRSGAQWQAVRDVVAALVGGESCETPAYLGLWDAARPVTMPAPPAEPLVVASGRLALAADGAPSLVRRPLPVRADGVEEAWFRGDHCDVAGGPGACVGLRRIAFDWVADGAKTAGLRLRAGTGHDVPQHADALAGSARGLPLRGVPSGAKLHASVEVYLQAHPAYWRRLPASVVWTDRDWLSRGERLVARTEVAPVSVPENEMASATA